MRALIAAAALLATMPAWSQTARPGRTQEPSALGSSGTPGCGLAIDRIFKPECRIKAATSDLAAAIAKPLQDLADYLSGDIETALSMSSSIPGLPDGNGQACWLAARDFVAVVKQHPLPLTFHAITDLEALRLGAMAAQKVCTNTACTQVFQDLSNGIQRAAPIDLSIPIPSLSALCTKVPTVASEPVVEVPPASTPTPSPPQ